ncbi:uncharacterized protein TM35_000016880 [Trypanosoma theileri]|uniref:NAD(P)-binding domain-containing protein n=1 Tax=Trypanosoma theileri TaxID=67003 RepID=A0A1X0PAG0_9TRYP|nr:uncharacterized protein TM35_000016880 [Trypanosoma theileri]ORC93811.1 hypothetical protein TM35_000016880 [Trypanosoma theileri]
MPLTHSADAECGDIVFERPRRLGPGVEVFNANDVPITPIGPCVQPEEYPSKLSINENTFSCFNNTESTPPSLGSFASQMGGLSESQTRSLENSSSFSMRKSLTNNHRVLQHQLRRILLVGKPGLICTHVASKLLKNGHHVRLLERDYRSKIALRSLAKLVETRPSRLSLFYEDDISLAVADCDGVVYLDGPDTSDASDTEEIQKRFLESMQDLFISIRNNGKSVRWVVLITPASSMFPVETTLLEKKRREQQAQRVALREAMRLSEKSGVPLTVILHSMVVGPSLIGECDGNVQAFVNFSRQKRCFTTPLYYNIVDVRDVAEACVAVLLSPAAAHQLYILSAGEMSLGQMATTLHECIPTLSSPTLELPAPVAKLLMKLGVLNLIGCHFCECIASERFGYRYTLSSRKAQRQLGIQLRSPPVALITAVAQTLNLPAEEPQEHLVTVPPLHVKIDGARWQRWQKGFLLAGMCTVFCAIGYVGGIYFFSRQIEVKCK